MDNKENEFLRKFLYQQTGELCCIAVADFGEGACYQVMTEHGDTDIFWNWYCDNYPDTQFYKTRYECVVKFLFYYKEWQKAGKPKPDYLL